ncbi:hypothetical protein ACN47E_010154 [Coniothyrium glycines]
MFLLRRSAVRAFSASATPSKVFLAKPRSITSITPAAIRSKQQHWAIASFQRRFASDEAAKTGEAAEAAVADTPDNFAQTAAEAPVEENLTPAQQEAQAPPTDAKATVDEDALAAVAQTTATQRSIRIQRPGEPPAEPSKMVYVGNLYFEVTADQVRRVFARFGEIEKVRIVYDGRGLSRGFGYVEFQNIADAQAAIDNLDMQVFEGRNLVVQFHRGRTERKPKGLDGEFIANQPSKTLFIGNMSFEMSDKDLNDLFRDIRNVMDVRVAIDRRTGQPRGFAHADFMDVASATHAKEVLEAKVIYGRQLRVDYSKSASQQQRNRGADANSAPSQP